jgi:hypothetical protein
MYATQEELRQKLPNIPPHRIVLTKGTEQGSTEAPLFVDVFASSLEEVQSAIELGGTYHHELTGHVVTFVNPKA